MKTFWFFRLRFCRAYDSAYDSVFRFSLGHKRFYNSNYDSDASENQPLWFISISLGWCDSILVLLFSVFNSKLIFFVSKTSETELHYHLPNFWDLFSELGASCVRSLHCVIYLTAKQNSKDRRLVFHVVHGSFKKYISSLVTCSPHACICYLFHCTQHCLEHYWYLRLHSRTERKYSKSSSPLQR